MPNVHDNTAFPVSRQPCAIKPFTHAKKHPFIRKKNDGIGRNQCHRYLLFAFSNL